MENLNSYINSKDILNRIERATDAAIDYIKSHNHTDTIGKQRYRVRTMLPEGPNVFLTTLISERSRHFYQLDYERNTIYFTPVQLIGHIAKVTKDQGSTSPSNLPLNELIEKLVSEIEVLPQVLELEQQGMFVEASKLLKV